MLFHPIVLEILAAQDPLHGLQGVWETTVCWKKQKYQLDSMYDEKHI